MPSGVRSILRPRCLASITTNMLIGDSEYTAAIPVRGIGVDSKGNSAKHGVNSSKTPEAERSAQD